VFATLRGLLRVAGCGAPSFRLIGLLALATASLALTASSASAFVAYAKLGKIAGPAPGETFSQLKSESVAVNDKNGHVYVADSGTHRVYDFASSSATSAEAVWDGTATPAGEWTGNLALAVDNTSGDVYVADSTAKVIEKFDQNGNLIAFFGDTEPSPNGQLAGLKTPAGSFSPATEGSFGIAVDQATHDLYVLDAHREVVDVFSAEGLYLSQITAAPNTPFNREGGDGIAVNDKNSRVLVSGEGNEGVPLTYVFDTSGAYVETLGGRTVAANNASGDFYLAENGVVGRFGSTGAFLDQITGTSGGLAVDQASGNLYVSDSSSGSVKIYSGTPVILPDVATKPATALTTMSATFNGEVNPAGFEVKGCAFEYGQSTAYGELAPCAEYESGGTWHPLVSSSELGTGTEPVPVRADVTNLKPGATYHYRLSATNEHGPNTESADQEFFTGASVDSTSVSQVAATSALLETELNPHGLPTTYHFEYDTAPYTEGGPAHGTSTSTATAGAGNAELTRSVQVQGLHPATVYHYRVVATNSLGTVEGEDRVFTTQGAGGSISQSLLPDGRGWEMVSPPEKGGVPLDAITEQGGDIQAAADGSGLAYVARGSIDGEAPGNRSPAFSELLSRRGGVGSSSWSTRDVTTPNEAPAGVLVGHGSEYQLFSSDLSLAAVDSFTGTTLLSPQASERTPYLRQPNGEYTPLVTAANVPPGTHFGEVKLPSGGVTIGVIFVDATPDLAHLVLSSLQDLSEPVFTAGGHRSLYEWTAGALTLLSQVPSGPATVCGGSGFACLPAAEAGLASELGSIVHITRHALSSDGSRAVFNTTDSVNPSHLFLRDIGRGETVQLDAAESGCGACGNGQEPRFQDASADGSRVFFKDSSRLTEDSTAAGVAPDLYMCQIEVTAGHLACALTDLTVDHNPGEHAIVQELVLGAAVDGSAVYFVATGALTASSSPAGEAAAPGAPNLYRYDTETSSLSLIAVLSGADGPDWSSHASGPALGGLTARVSPDGRWLAFMSQRPLTGYDNRDAASGVRDEEVFLYDAAANEGKGKLICASCNPTGARPRGLPDEPGTQIGHLVDRRKIWDGASLAASIPGWTNIALDNAIYQSRYLSNSGRLFFNANDALVPQDSNGTEDVYQYEPPQGEGQPPSNNCTASSPTYSPASGGCVNLVSSGTSGEESAFLDASESGNDVFFLTAAQLSPSDRDTALDVYDSHVCSAELPCPPPPAPAEPECNGDACQSLVQAPNDPTPGSLTFQGPGNVSLGLTPSVKKKTVKRTVRCKKPKKPNRGKCVKGKKKAKRATSNRGAKS
jgi:hypothetical protein